MQFGRTLRGQTGYIPPRSSVQPQHCHRVDFPHITHCRAELNGSFVGSSWCFESGRMGFALSSMVTFLDKNNCFKRMYLTPTFFRMRLRSVVMTHGTLSPSFDQCQTSFPNAIFLISTMLLGFTLQNMVLPCYVSVHDCKGIKQGKTNLKKGN